MRWHKFSNFIIAIVLTLAYVIVTLLNIIGPMHMTPTGGMYGFTATAGYSIAYFIIAVAVLWGVYINLRNKPELLFFTLLILGIVTIIGEIFLWGWLGP